MPPLKKEMAKGDMGKNVRAMCEIFKERDDVKKLGGKDSLRKYFQQDVEYPDDGNRVKKLIGDFEHKFLGEGKIGPNLKNPQKSKLKSDEWKILKSPNLLKKSNSPRRFFSHKKKEKLIEELRNSSPNSPVKKFVGRRKKVMLKGQKDIRDFFCGPEKLN